MNQEATAVQSAFAIGDEVIVVGEEARRACGADRGTVVGHSVPACDSDEPVEVIVACANGSSTNVKVAPSELRLAT